eukprot:959284_1
MLKLSSSQTRSIRTDKGLDADDRPSLNLPGNVRILVGEPPPHDHRPQPVQLHCRLLALGERNLTTIREPYDHGAPLLSSSVTSCHRSVSHSAMRTAALSSSLLDIVSSPGTDIAC